VAAASGDWKDIPLAATVDPRYADTSIDALLTNGYIEQDASGVQWVRRRAGTSGTTWGVSVRESDMTARAWGVGFSGFGAILVGSVPWIFGSPNALTDLYTFASISDDIWFDASTVITSTNFYASTGKEGAVSTGGAFANIIDPNYPASTVNGSAYLNGYLYVMDTSGSIWGTPNQNDFATWSATNVVNAWGTDGTPTGIRSHMNEVVAFKSETCEVFYDSGNSVGSPLLPVQQVNIRWGTLNPRTIKKVNNALFWYAREKGTNRKSVVMMENFAPTPVSTPAVDRILSAASDTAAWTLHVGGHDFYCISYSSGTAAAGTYSAKTLAFNLTTQLWSLWTTTIPYNSTYPNSSGLFCVDYSTTLNSALSKSGQTLIFNENQTYDTNKLTTASSVVQYPLTLSLRSDNFTGGTSVRKMASGLRVRADRKAAGVMKIRWSDDDYQTWSSWKSIDLNKSVPKLVGIQGTFSRRAFEVSYSGTDVVRLSALEMMILLGDI